MLGGFGSLYIYGSPSQMERNLNCHRLPLSATYCHCHCIFCVFCVLCIFCVFTCFCLFLPVFNLLYLFLPVFTCFYHFCLLHLFYLVWSVLIFVSLFSFMLTCFYLFLPVFTCFYLYLFVYGKFESFCNFYSWVQFKIIFFRCDSIS